MFGVGKSWCLGGSTRYAAILVLLACLCILLVACSESSEKKSSGDRNGGESALRSESNSVEDTTEKERTGSKPKASKKATEKGESETTIENEPTDTIKEEATQKEATREKTEESTEEEVPESIPADAVPDTAFDALLPDLQAITADTIVLPAELPAALGNPAIWGERPTEEPRIYPEYGIVFTNTTPEDTFAEPPRVDMLGTLTSAPIPVGMPDNVPEGFEESNAEEVSLPDGTVATLRYLTPVGLTNTSSKWEGRFEMDDAGYWLEVYGDESSGETARRALASMVKVPNEAPPEETTEDEDPIATFIDDYYKAVSDEDWSQTYSYLTKSAQDEFTEEEWVAAQEIRASQNPRPPIASVETVGGAAGGDAAILDVQTTYEDGSQETISGITIVADTVNEPYGIKRGLSESDVEYLRGLLEGS